MIDLIKLADMQDCLYKVVQYCHDNEFDLMVNFIGENKANSIDEIHGVYLSGSKAKITYTTSSNLGELGKEIDLFIPTSNLIEWVGNHQRL